MTGEAEVDKPLRVDSLGHLLKDLDPSSIVLNQVIVGREWFINFRFPDYEKARMVDSELGQIPEGWERVSFSELLEFSLGGDWGKEEPTSKEKCPVAIIRGTDFEDVRYGKNLRSPLRFIPEASGYRIGSNSIQNALSYQ